MNTLKEIEQPIIPEHILKEFDEFKDWHFELKASLDKLNLSGQDEVEYLMRFYLGNEHIISRRSIDLGS
jgi:hypothetical protein